MALSRFSLDLGDRSAGLNFAGWRCLGGGRIRRAQRFVLVDAPPLRKTDAPLIRFQAADAQLQAIPFFDVAVRLFERAVAHFAEMQQPFQPIIQRDKRAKIDDVGHRAFHQHALVIPLQRVIPGIGQQALATQGDTVGFAIQAEHVHVDFLADFEHVTRVIDAVPGQFADVDQAVRAAQVDERAKIAQPGDGAAHHVALVQLGQQAGFLLGAPFALRFAFGEDQPAAVLIDLDHFHADFLTTHPVKRFAAFVPLQPGADSDHVRRGDEPFQHIPPDKNPTPVMAGDGYLDHLVIFQQLAGRVPVILLKAHVDRHDEITIAVSRIQDVDRHALPDFQRFAKVSVEAFQVLRRNDAILFGTHVHDDLIRLDLQNDSIADLAPVRRRVVEGCFQHLHEAFACVVIGVRVVRRITVGGSRLLLLVFLEVHALSTTLCWESSRLAGGHCVGVVPCSPALQFYVTLSVQSTTG